MAGMLRKVNGRVERRGSDGVWRPLSAEERAAVETRVEAAAQSVSDSGGVGLTAELAELSGETQIPDETISPDSIVEAQQIKNDDQNGLAAERSEIAQEDRSVLDIGLVPGLLSDESPRSTSGAARLQKLRATARGKKNGSRITVRAKPPKEVVVPATAAEVSGPDAEGTRLKDGAVRRNVAVKESPVLLEGRPQWVKDLFEAHFRSELAYQLRRMPSGKDGRNRMKLSRQDYAIGWLVMFDKARSDPGILRVKSRS